MRGKATASVSGRSHFTFNAEGDQNMAHCPNLVWFHLVRLSGKWGKVNAQGTFAKYPRLPCSVKACKL
jgi:hypothetical protein